MYSLKTAGVDTQKAEAEIKDITAGVENKQAQNSLIKAETLAKELSNKLMDATLQNQTDLVQWTTNKVKSEMEIAQNEAYISKETRRKK